MIDYFVFDDIDTRDFDGILVYFDNVDTVPKRVGEFVEIPNRNGSFFLDGGRYEDVTHTYDIIALSKEHASDLINALASKVGYFRLQDSFNPDEYYSAVLDSEIEPVVTKERDKLTFKVMFTRKPQRWLTSGESAVEVDSGDELTNPTLFESGPLLAIKGYGTIGFNGYEVELENAILGRIVLASGVSNINVSGASYTINIDTSLLNTGDMITLDSLETVWKFRSIVSGHPISSTSISSNTGITGSSATCQYKNYVVTTNITLPDLEFAKGTSTTYTNTTVISGNIKPALPYTAQCVLTVSYDGNQTISISYAFTYSSNVDASALALSYREVIGDSTKSQLGNPTYIDCDLGDAYRIEGGEYVSLNGNVDLGSDLPKLGVGENEITFDNTVTELKITPRWWKV